MSKVSVTIITLNEEANLPACLDSLKWADEIVVVDSESRDQTVQIAKDFGCRVLTNPWPGHKEQKNVAVEVASHEWIFSVDADERLTPEIQREVRKIVSDPNSMDGYAFPRKNYFLGKWMRHGGWYPDRVLRLFRKSKGHFGGINPHDKVMISSGKVGALPYPITHLTYTSFDQYLIKQDAYSRIGAEELFKSGKSGRTRRVTSLSLTGKFAGKFLETYLWKGGCLDGLHGLIASLGGAYFAALRLARLWELRRLASQGEKR
ncbi:MAG: glycosyltransferase family 2 protein [Candidatus Manganitrophaceae bacterium]